MPKKILIVDDEPDIRLVISDFLKTMGFEVAEAASGEEGFALFSREQFHLVLSDIKMPGIDGELLLSMVKEKNPEVPFILMSGYQPKKAQRVELPEGVPFVDYQPDDFLSKPFSLITLYHSINNCLKKYYND